MTTLRTVLVDDVDEMRELLRMLLTRDGRFTMVGEAGDGGEAIAIVEREQPDLVVLDVKMPTIGGFEALPTLRSRSPRTRVVMLSALSADEMARPALDLGAVGYIEKQAEVSQLPAQLFALANVLETVQRVLDTTYAADPTSAREARSDMRAALAARVGNRTVDVVELLTTELVVNSIEHAGAKATVSAEVHRDKVRVAVSDDGPGVPVRREPSLSEESGRGLGLVDLLSRRWGVDASPSGKVVWFEVAIDP